MGTICLCGPCAYDNHRPMPWWPVWGGLCAHHLPGASSKTLSWTIHPGLLHFPTLTYTTLHYHTLHYHTLLYQTLPYLTKHYPIIHFPTVHLHYPTFISLHYPTPYLIPRYCRLSFYIRAPLPPSLSSYPPILLWLHPIQLYRLPWQHPPL